jgi:hypothetical protein
MSIQNIQDFRRYRIYFYRVSLLIWLQLPSVGIPGGNSTRCPLTIPSLTGCPLTIPPLTIPPSTRGLSPSQGPPEMTTPPKVDPPVEGPPGGGIGVDFSCVRSSVRESILFLSCLSVQAMGASHRFLGYRYTPNRTSISTTF